MNQEFISALSEIEKEKGIKKEELIEAIENALVSAYKKEYGSNAQLSAVVDRENGTIKVVVTKEIVDDVAFPQTEISKDEAQKINKRLDVGDVIDVDITPKSFGRIAAQTAKQVVVQKIREAERNMVIDEFVNKENNIVTGIVQRTEKQNVMVEVGKTEAILTQKEQVEGESYNPGERIKLYVVEVKRTSKGPQIVLSRSHPTLVKRLFEQEVPEIADGTVEIKSVSREAGMRTKIAVHSNDKNVDSIGSCVGQKGIRVQNITDELRGEKIDIIKWSENPAEYISAALSPAQVISIEVNEEEKSSVVTVPDYQLSLAIGKEGQNVRLAAKLTGWKIDICSVPVNPDEVPEIPAQ